MEKIKYTLTKKKYFILFFTITLIVIFLYFQNKQKTAASSNIRSTTIQRGALKETMILSGDIKAHENTRLKFQSGGKLVVLKVKQGDLVKKGQFIAALDQRDLQKRLKKELNDYLTSRWDFEQGKDDVKNTVITSTVQRILDQNQFSLDNSVLDVELQSLAIEFANLFTPIQGVVTSTSSLQPGINVSATDTIATIVNPDSLYFDVVADQTEVTKLKENMSGYLKLDAYIDEVIPATIDSIGFAPKTDESGTVYSVEILFNAVNNQNYKYRLGMTGDVEFVINEKSNILTVPIDFVNEDETGQYVYVSKDKKNKSYIKTGLETENTVEIVSGVKEGTVVYD